MELPAHFMRRTAAADTELGGVPIQVGDKVILWYVSGNRDEAEFEQPGVFDVGRNPNRHLSSAAAARTCAWACTWPGWRSR